MHAPKPGYTQFSVRPQMGPLRFIESVVPTPHGSITLKLEKQKDCLGMSLHCPPGTEALVGVPVHDGVGTISINNRLAWSQEGVRPVPEARYSHRDAHWMYWAMTPGAWQITVH